MHDDDLARHELADHPARHGLTEPGGGSDVAAHVQAFRPFADAGFDDVYIANMGPHYGDFFALYGEQVLPRLRA